MPPATRAVAVVAMRFMIVLRWVAMARQIAVGNARGSAIRLAAASSTGGPRCRIGDRSSRQRQRERRSARGAHGGAESRARREASGRAAGRGRAARSCRTPQNAPLGVAEAEDRDERRRCRGRATSRRACVGRGIREHRSTSPWCVRRPASGVPRLAEQRRGTAPGSRPIGQPRGARATGVRPVSTVHTTAESSERARQRRTRSARHRRRACARARRRTSRTRQPIQPRATRAHLDCMTAHLSSLQNHCRASCSAPDARDCPAARRDSVDTVRDCVAESG